MSKVDRGNLDEKYCYFVNRQIEKLETRDVDELVSSISKAMENKFGPIYKETRDDLRQFIKYRLYRIKKYEIEMRNRHKDFSWHVEKVIDIFFTYIPDPILTLGYMIGLGYVAYYTGFYLRGYL